jgi:hypothetical protein
LNVFTVPVCILDYTTVAVMEPSTWEKRSFKNVKIPSSPLR